MQLLSLPLCITFALFALVNLASASPAVRFAPAPAARSEIVNKQVTRDQIVARSRVRPAKRQTSAAPYPVCPDSPKARGEGQIYASFFDVRFRSQDGYSGSQNAGSFQECKQICANFGPCNSANFRNGNLCDVYVGSSGLVPASNSFQVQKGVSCADFVAANEADAAGVRCCNAYI